MKALLLLGGLWAATQAAWGQVYAAPGMPVQVQRRQPAIPAAAPRQVPVYDIVFARFWQLPDSMKRREMQPLGQAVRRHIRYPATTLRAGIEGTVYVRLTVLPSGEVSHTEIVRRVLDEAPFQDVTEEMRAKGKGDLDAEMLRVLRALRFKSATSTDTVTIGQRFVLQ